MRFKNGAINAKDAEIVCNMTKNIRHEERIEEIQRRCCMLLEKGKGWDYIGAMCQLMANKESVFMKQGLLDFGADFEQDLDRAAKYVELNLSQLNAAIRRMKQGAKLGEKERAQAMRLGIDVSMSEGSEQLLQLLNDMKAKFEYIGSHPDLVASASMWDGKTDPDPVGQMIERAKREREAAEAENEMTDEEWMEKKAREEAAAMTPSLFAMERRVRTSADAIREHVNGADADGKLRTHGLEGLSEDQALKRAFEQAGENLPLLEKLVKAAAEKLGGRAMMRPVNKENGLATKKPSTARDKANRDYGGKIERVVDLIGGTVELPMNGDYAAAVETVQSMLPEGAEVAKVKKLGFTTDAPSYKDVKVSVRFPNGGIGEIIIVDAFVNDAKFNRGGHVIYEIVRELEPYKENNANVAKALEELKNLSSAVYDHFTDEASLERAKSSASSALEGLQPDLGVKNFLLSSSVADMVKSPELMSKVIKPASVVSTATPSFSLIQNISGDDVAQNGGNVNTKNSFAMTADKNLAAVHSLSPEKFLAAVELGGMPMPSVAITRLDRPYEWGGEGAINLIGKPEMVDPKKRSKVYMHDAYTGTMPPVKYKRKNAAAAERLKQDALDKLAVYGMGESDGLRRGIFSEDEEVVDGDAADWGYNRAMMAYWAITQAGYAPRPKMTEKPGQMSKDKHSALKPWVAKLKKKDMKPEDFTADELEEFRGLMVAYYEGKKLRGAAKEYREMEAWRLARCAREEADKVRNYSTAKVPDGLENGKRFYEYAKKHAKAYSAWCKAEAQKYLGDKVFQRKYERRNWRGDVEDEWWGHEKYTLGNVLKYLRENKARGEEMSSITPGVFLAGVAEEMRNMREIGWARERVIGAEEYKKAKDEYEEAFSAFYDKACEIGREAGGGYFDLADAAMYNLLELVQGGKRMPARESVARALEQSGGKWTEESVDAAMHLLDKALGMPSDYMEAVPQRAVNMSEWEYAVLPKGLKKNKEVTEALKANGIQPIWHDGTEEGRKAALAGLVNEPTVSFNIAGANEQDAYAAERAEIERAARENGTWLKAPNGEDSKLTPEQWTAVRTRAFKRWFGDWEKDPEHASRVVDENGEPLVVYHGTRRGGFRVFRTEGRGKTSDTGAFFSSSRDNAEGYAMNEDGEVPKDMLYEVFLNIREPETVDFKGNNWNRVPDRPVGYIVKFKSGDTEWYDNREEAENAADMYESDPGTVEEDWGDEDNSYTLDDLAREVREEGYSDGLIAENIIDHAATGRRVSKEPATDYIVFDPKQIKSATDNVGTYDAGNADITFNLTIGKDRICRTQKEAVKMAGRKGSGKPLRLVNEFLNLEAELTRTSENKFGHGGSKTVSVAQLMSEGFDEETAHMMHWTAWGNVSDLFANAERMKFVRAYKRKEERKGFIHIFSPFTLEGIEKELEAEIQIMLHQKSNLKPTAYVLQVDVKERSRIPQSSNGGEPSVNSRNAADDIRADFPEFVNTESANNTLAMTRGAEDALEILRKRETEREGERLIREWQKQCELWSRLGGTDDAKIGKGSRIFGEMMALVSATKGVLPPEYTRMRGLGMSLQWAEIYADMANSGEVPMRGEMKDIVVDVEGAFKTYFEHVPDFGIISSEDMVEMSEEVRGRRHHSTGVSV
ncbi:MAG: hypothetical protein MSQ05_09295 [Akkermansia sp.]|nr:hypothetical protein [Akkermansia sp.]